MTPISPSEMTAQCIAPHRVRLERLEDSPTMSLRTIPAACLAQSAFILGE